MEPRRVLERVRQGLRAGWRTVQERKEVLEALDALIKRQAIYQGHDVESWQVFRDRIRRQGA